MSWFLWVSEAWISYNDGGARRSINAVVKRHVFDADLGGQYAPDSLDYDKLMEKDVSFSIYPKSEVSINERLVGIRQMDRGSWELPQDVGLNATFSVEHFQDRLSVELSENDVVWDTLANFLVLSRPQKAVTVVFQIASDFVGRQHGVPKVHFEEFISGKRTAWSWKNAAVSLCIGDGSCHWAYSKVQQ